MYTYVRYTYVYYGCIWYLLAYVCNSDYPIHTREHGGKGLLPLYMACAYNHICSAELLIKFGAIVAVADSIGWTSLHWACANNSEATAKLLLQHHCPTGEQVLSSI